MAIGWWCFFIELNLVQSLHIWWDVPQSMTHVAGAEASVCTVALSTIRSGLDLQLWHVVQCHYGLCCIDPDHLWSGCSQTWTVVTDLSNSKFIHHSWRCLSHRLICCVQRALTVHTLRWYDCLLCGIYSCASGIRVLVRHSQRLHDKGQSCSSWWISNFLG